MLDDMLSKDGESVARVIELQAKTSTDSPTQLRAALTRPHTCFKGASHPTNVRPCTPRVCVPQLSSAQLS